MEATFYHNGMTGGPAPGTASAGDTITVLDACLVNGFNSITPTSITRSGSTATLTYTSHGYKVGQFIEVGGADQTEYNGKKRVLTVPDANTLTFAVTGTPATPATGTLTCKTPSLGWTKEYSGTNLAVYRAPSGNRRYLRVDDTPTNNTIVLGYNAMTGVSTGTDPFPATSWLSTSPRIGKANDTTGWSLVGDDKRFFLLSASSTSYWTMFIFGDFPSFKSGDTDNTMLFAGNSTTDTTNTAQPVSMFSHNVSSTTALTGTIAGNLYRDYTGLLTPGSTGIAFNCFYGSTTNTLPAMLTGAPVPVGPDPLTGGYHWSFIDLVEHDGTRRIFRGRVPGVIQIMNNIDYSTSLKQAVLPSVGDFAQVFVAGGGAFSGSTGTGFAFALCDWDTVFATGI